eukprot:CAMPEP_0206260950 /NCGR_PEP_ID=MMETSP0047_2-20121206/27376_1 /ASSEMBLY_ACC=CAM_ASM_000192 /TAXON_ID=195065 /ORGANISM="Chroomonas mesostigmatica_cf, Strain CCMP1168" /LENGTH=258 /DNA_ID=CAMNT_0053688095 /DNA_START=18 /DNA_END=794 /DNA_ORIENTATION=-
MTALGSRACAVGLVFSAVFHGAGAFVSPAPHGLRAGALSLRAGRPQANAAASLWACRAEGAEEAAAFCAQDDSRMSRRSLVMAAAFAAATGLGAREAAAKPDDEGKVKASSPAQALDMIITMKAAKNMRELGPKVEKGDFKSVTGWLTSPWSSGTARFIRKNKVIESLSTSVKGASAGPDLESDPAFYNEPSPESKQVETLANAFFAELDKMEAACTAKSADEVKTAYAGAVKAFDVVLTELGLPTVSKADPKLIMTP